LNKKLTATTLLALLIMVSLSIILSASAQTETATVIITSSVGGTVNPAPGTYTVNNGSNMTFTATPNSGFKFQYWVIAGNYTLGHNLPAATLPYDVTVSPEYVPVYPAPSTSASDSLIFTQNPLVVYHGFGYTYTYQAVFTPINAATPTPSTGPTATATASPTSPPAGGLSTDSLYAIIAVLVVIVVIVIVVAAVFARRSRK
jgi:hypothetical protein